ncbi:MAG: hypothetical protein ACUBOA_12645 [Candidatus Loosdrechtia sp.]|uniref:hypothetical protein n=1 Tax=Candidatus Loosdrechtia sp. TaxID=3101272 RepID=UPI003A5D5491|nr:MAG: hypothetical protein QY305_12035 [Candidatus Jettenia sp. AMX2]
MVKNKYVKKCLIIFFIIYCYQVQNVFAHKGHDHSHDVIITIGKKTFAHLQSVLSAYQGIYEHFIRKETEGIADLARKMSDAAQQGVLSEPEGPGRHMMEHVFEGAEELLKAGDIQEKQKAFATVSAALFPFFESWPNQLKRNGLILCQCGNGYYWLQSRNSPAVCPYSFTETSACSDIKEIVK